jgi:hypothetical protein
MQILLGFGGDGGSMNRLFMLPLLALLTACVSYYQPESALEDGVYYAEDDPAYRYNSGDYYSGVFIYPWASLDYFYFGYWPYPGYGFNFVYPEEPGFALGYYTFYSSWYSRGYATYYHPPIWRPYRNDCHHHGRCVENEDDRDDGNDRYAGDGGQNYGYPGGEGEENAFYSNNVKNKMGRTGYPTTKRYVYKTPAGLTGYQGGAAQNHEFTKTGKSRAKPGHPPSSGPTKVHPAVASSSQGVRMAPSKSGGSGHSRQSPPSNSASYSRSSDSGKSSRQKDRD